MKWWLLLIPLVLGLAVWFWLRRKGGVSPSPVSPTGTCALVGEACANSTQCCEGVCGGSICRAPLIPAFEIGNITPVKYPNSILGVRQGTLAAVDAGSNSFASWDGTSQLEIIVPAVDANGNVVSTSTEAVQEPLSGVNASVGQIPGKVFLNNDSTISSSDYSLYLAFDSAGNLGWVPYSQLPNGPDKFQFNTCPAVQTCNEDSDCCGPFKKCGTDGKCQQCFGNMAALEETCCDNPPCSMVGNDYHIVCSNFVMECQSRCTGSANCADNQVQVCTEDNNGNWNYTCQLKCTGPAPTDCQDYTCKQTSDGGYDWYCNTPSCNPPNQDWNCGTQVCASGPDGNDPNNCLYIQNGKPVLPVYDCGWQKWTCQPTCGANACDSTICASGQVPKCDDTTNFTCQCVTSNPDYCGSLPRPSSDAVCKYVDESKCGGPGPGWRWYQESAITDQCVLAALNGWKQFPCTDANGLVHQIMLDQGNNPFLPTVNADLCRGAGAFSTSENANVQNPEGHVSGLNTSNCKFIPYDPTYSDYYQSPMVGNPPYCLVNTSQVCQNGGSFIPLSNPYLHDIPSAGEIPTPTEVISSGMGGCSCPDQTAGLNCQITTQNCSSNGYPVSTPGDPASYSCTCNPGYYGKSCQYTRNDCTNQGTPENSSDSLVCSCDPGAFGSRCQYSRVTCNNQGTPSDSGVCSCDFNYSGSNCASCVSTAPSQPSLVNGNLYMIGIVGSSNLLGATNGGGFYYMSNALDCANLWIYTAVSNGGTLNTYPNIPMATWYVSPGDKVYQNPFTITIDSCGFIRETDNNNFLVAVPNPNPQADFGALTLISVSSVSQNNGLLYLIPFTGTPPGEWSCLQAPIVAGP